MVGGNLFYRIVAADRNRGYILLTSWGKPVIQRNCDSMHTLTGLTQKSLDKMLANVKEMYSAGSMTDVTDPTVAGQLRRLFEAQAAPAVPEE